MIELALDDLEIGLVGGKIFVRVPVNDGVLESIQINLTVEHAKTYGKQLLEMADLANSSGGKDE